jgi:hypothetical protein
MRDAAEFEGESLTPILYRDKVTTVTTVLAHSANEEVVKPERKEHISAVNEGTCSNMLMGLRFVK